MVFLRTAKWISVFHKMWAISSLNKQLSQSQEATCSMAIGSHHYYIKYNSNKSPTRCNNFPKYNPDVYLQLNMFRAFSRPSPGAQWLQWQPLVLPLYRSDSRAVFMAGSAGRPAWNVKLRCQKVKRTWALRNCKLRTDLSVQWWSSCEA